MKSTRSVTIKDVANHAGVATSTVSRVINDTGTISEETKVRVFKAMEELNFHPNAAASNLASKRPTTLGLILPNNSDELFLNPFFIKVMRGFSICAQQAGYNLMYSFSDEEAEELEYIKRQTISRVVDGFLLFTSRINDKSIDYLHKCNFPFVVIGRPENPDICWVDNDNFQAAYQATNYLISKGLKKIAFIGGDLTFDFNRIRLEGYRQALNSRTVEKYEEYVYLVDELVETEGYTAMKQALDQDVEGVLTVDDTLAFGVLEALQKENRKCAVIGFNNTLKGSLTQPSLTSIDVNPEKIGQSASSLLIDLVEKRSPKVNHIVVDTFLVERESTEIR